MSDAEVLAAITSPIWGAAGAVLVDAALTEVALPIAKTAAGRAVAHLAPLAQQVWERITGTPSTQTAASPWTLPNLQRGQLIEDMLGRNLPRNFPVIDRWSNGVITSIKSLDLNAPTYQNIGALTSKVQGYIDAVANFQGAWWLQANMITGRDLLLAVPSSASTQAQWAALQALQQYASNLGIALTIIQIP